MKKKQDSFVRIGITVLLIAMTIVGMAILYKATNTGSTELRSKAAENRDVLVKEWEFKKGTEGWSGVGTIKVDQADEALRGTPVQRNNNNGQIINSSVNEKMPQGLKYLKFKLALRRTILPNVSPERGSCPQVMITCPDGKQQPAYTPDCKPSRCPTSTQPRTINQGGASGENNSVGGYTGLEACPQDIKSCPDGTQLIRVNTVNGCVFPECPVRRASPTPEIYNVVVQYMAENQWSSQTVKVVPDESYTEFTVQLPLKAFTIQKIRFVLPAAAYQYTFWFDWIRLWSKVVISPTSTNTPTPKPTSRLTPTPCLPLPSCVYVGTVDSRGSIVYCSPPAPPSGRVYCPRPTATPTLTVRQLGKCIVGGCNGELCVDENSPAKNTICVYKVEYQCYKSAKCTRQTSGVCGWTQTTELSSCLNKYSY